MTWANPGDNAPNFDSQWADPGAAGADSFGNVPNSPVGAQWLLGGWFANTKDTDVTVTVADADGVVFIPATLVPAHTALPIPIPFMPVIGPLQWKCSDATGVNAKLWGRM